MQDQTPEHFQKFQGPLDPNPPKSDAMKYWNLFGKGTGGDLINASTLGVFGADSLVSPDWQGHASEGLAQYRRDLNAWNKLSPGQRVHINDPSNVPHSESLNTGYEDRAEKNHLTYADEIYLESKSNFPFNPRLQSIPHSNEVYSDDDLRGNDDNTLEPRDPGNPPKKQGKGKNAKRMPKTKTRSAPLAGMRSGPIAFKSVPLNVMGNVSGGNYVNQMGLVRHNTLGLDGIRLRGRQQLCQLLAVAQLPNIFKVSSPAFIYNENILSVAPIHLNSTLKVKAATYQRYCFRHVTIRYVNINGLTFPGAFAWGLQFDPDISQRPQAFQTVAEMQKSAIFAKATPSQSISIDYTGEALWYNSIETQNDIAETRQNEQLQFAMFPNGNGLAPFDQGYLEIEYVIDLFESVHVQYQIPFLASPFEQSLIQTALKALRSKSKLKMLHSESDLDSSEGFELVPKASGKLR